MTWVLMLMIHAGVYSHNDDVAVTTARFYGQNACEAAGRDLVSLSRGTVQDVKYACIHDAPAGS